MHTTRAWWTTSLFLAALGGIARAQCATWTPLVAPAPLDGPVYTLCVFDDGSGYALYAGGNFVAAGGTTLNHVAKWNGTSWTPVGTGIPGSGVYVTSLAQHGGLLYAGGFLLNAGGPFLHGLASWDGSNWSGVNSGMLVVNTLAEWNRPSGTTLVAGGQDMPSVPVPVFSVLTSGGWGPVGGLQGAHGSVDSLCTFDDGSGPALFIGGNFSMAGSTVAIDIVKWDGATFSALPNAPNNPYDGIGAMAVFDDGSGPALYVSGPHPIGSTGVLTQGIARWDGSAFSAVGGDIAGFVSAMVVFDDGSGPALYVSGSFTSAGGAPASHVAKWNGSVWSGLGSGPDSGPAELITFDDGGDADVDLFMGGAFTSVAGSSAPYAVQWHGCGTLAYCFGDGSGTACPCGNVGANGRGCANSVTTAGALLGVTGTGSVLRDTVVLHGSDMPDAAVLYFQGTTQTNGGSGAVFGDGLRCAGGTIVRIATRINVGHASSYPGPGDVRLSLRGGVPAAGGVRTYQAWYRNTSGLCGSGWNLTNAVQMHWAP